MVSILLSTAAVVAIPFLVKAATIAYTDKYGTLQERLDLQPLPNELGGLAVKFVQLPMLVALQCTNEFKYLMYKKTLVSFDQHIAGNRDAKSLYDPKVLPVTPFDDDEHPVTGAYASTESVNLLASRRLCRGGSGSGSGVEDSSQEECAQCAGSE